MLPGRACSGRHYIIVSSAIAAFLWIDVKQRQAYSAERERDRTFMNMRKETAWKAKARSTTDNALRKKSTSYDIVASEFHALLYCTDKTMWEKDRPRVCTSAWHESQVSSGAESRSHAPSSRAAAASLNSQGLLGLQLRSQPCRMLDTCHSNNTIIWL